MGLIKVIEFEALDNRHDTNLAPHINLICTLCGKIQDLPEGFPIAPDKAYQEVGFKVLDYRMEYYGICSECSVRTEKDR